MMMHNVIPWIINNSSIKSVHRQTSTIQHL